jgi:hypothetical protein
MVGAKGVGNPNSSRQQMPEWIKPWAIGLGQNGMKNWVVLIFLIAVVGCAARETSVQNPAQGRTSASPETHLAPDLGAADLEQALIGKWTVVFAHASTANAHSVAFRPDGTASLWLPVCGFSSPIWQVL